MIGPLQAGDPRELMMYLVQVQRPEKLRRNMGNACVSPTVQKPKNQVFQCPRTENGTLSLIYLHEMERVEGIPMTESHDATVLFPSQPASQADMRMPCMFKVNAGSKHGPHHATLAYVTTGGPL